MNEHDNSDNRFSWERHLATLVAQVHQTIAQTTRQCLLGNPGDIPAVLASNRLALYGAMDRLGSWINEFLSSEHETVEVLTAQSRVVEALRPLSATGPFFDRSYGKLRGYPGDFETIEIIYRCRPSGATLAALILDDYYLHTLAAQAVRNRLAYLVRQVGQETLQRCAPKRRPVRVLSLGSGSARELAMLSKDAAFVAAAAITCLDLDTEALRFAHNELAARFDGRVTYVKGNALEFAAGLSRNTQPYHVIYAAGLFDYLKDGLAKRLISDCHRMLAPGGTLIVGNFSVALPANERVLIEWLLEWRLLYRDEDDYRRIFAGTGFAPEDVRFDYEPLRVNLFAVAGK